MNDSWQSLSECALSRLGIGVRGYIINLTFTKRKQCSWIKSSNQCWAGSRAPSCVAR